jgi:DNA-binding transcriptional MerR regulator
MNEAQYPIPLVARLTGLSAHVIRILEQRYRAAEPQRTATKRRLYSQLDIERLNLLWDVTQAGHSIGQVAQLPTDELGKLVAAGPGCARQFTELARGQWGDSESRNHGVRDACMREELGQKWGGTVLRGGSGPGCSRPAASLERARLDRTR